MWLMRSSAHGLEVARLDVNVDVDANSHVRPRSPANSPARCKVRGLSRPCTTCLRARTR